MKKRNKLRSGINTAVELLVTAVALSMVLWAVFTDSAKADSIIAVPAPALPVQNFALASEGISHDFDREDIPIPVTFKLDDKLKSEELLSFVFIDKTKRRRSTSSAEKRQEEVNKQIDFWAQFAERNRSYLESLISTRERQLKNIQTFLESAVSAEQSRAAIVLRIIEDDQDALKVVRKNAKWAM